MIFGPLTVFLVPGSDQLLHFHSLGLRVHFLLFQFVDEGGSLHLGEVGVHGAVHEREAGFEVGELFDEVFELQAFELLLASTFYFFVVFVIHY